MIDATTEATYQARMAVRDLARAEADLAQAVADDAESVRRRRAVERGEVCPSCDYAHNFCKCDA